MKKVAEKKSPPIVAIPLVVELAIVGIQPRTIGIPIDVEHVRVAIAVENLHEIPSTPPPMRFCEIIRLYFILYFQYISISYQVFSFFLARSSFLLKRCSG